MYAGVHLKSKTVMFCGLFYFLFILNTVTDFSSTGHLIGFADIPALPKDFVACVFLLIPYVFMASPYSAMAKQCDIYNGGCSHFCVVKAQHAVCVCAAGYELV